MREKGRKRLRLWVAAATAAVCGACFAACGEKGAGQSGSSVQAGQSDQAEEVYTVTFIADGVVVGTDTYTAEDAEITAPAVPEKKGYTGEWEAYSPDKSDITVHAVYTPLLYELTLESEGNLGETTGGGTYRYGEKVTVCAEPYPGYVFIGWYEGNTRVSDDAEYAFEMPACATEYTAKFMMREDMEPFLFTYSVGACVIVGLQDDTLTSVVIPDCVTGIGTAAFSGCDKLKSIDIPDSVTAIGDRAFWECCSLADMEIPGSVTSIGHNAFCGCEALKSLEIPESVTSIGNNAFGYCRGLTSVRLPDNMTSIVPFMFSK